MKRRTALIFKRTAQLFSLLALTLFLVELTVSLVLPQPISGCMSMTLEDPLLQHRMPPNEGGVFKEDYTYTMRLNELGLRDDPIKEKGENTIRLLVIGDSFTQGLGVSNGETYSDFLEGLLNETYPKHDWDVVNAGVHAYGVAQYALQAKRLINKVDPDALLVMGCFNDLMDTLEYFVGPKHRAGEPLDRVQPFKRYHWDVEYWNKQKGEWSDSYSKLGLFQAGPLAFWHIPKGFPEHWLPADEREHLDLIHVPKAENAAPLGQITQSSPVFKWPPTPGADKYRVSIWPAHNRQFGRWTFTINGKSEGRSQTGSLF